MFALSRQLHYRYISEHFMYMSGGSATMNASFLSARNDMIWSGRLASGPPGIRDETQLNGWKLRHNMSLQEKP